MISFSLKAPILIGVLAVTIYYTDILRNFSVPKEGSKRSSDKAQEQAIKKRTELEKAVLKQSEVVLAEECSPANGICYIIQDEVKRIHGDIVARRLMRIKGSRIIFTVMNLEVPERLEWNNLKSANWPVSKLIVPVEYCQMQIAIGFITEAMALDSLAKQQVLMIGLGGGSTSSFFSIMKEMDINVETTVVELDPFVLQLATKYFDHDSTPGVTNVVIRDGIEYLEEVVQDGKAFRSILLDACYSEDETKTGLVCPIKEFLSEKVIRNLYDVLTDDGVLSINTLSVKDISYHENEALKAYQSIFPSCYLLPYIKARHMMVCSKKENWTWEDQEARFRKNLYTVMERFDFQHLQALL